MALPLLIKTNQREIQMKVYITQISRNWILSQDVVYRHIQIIP